MEGKLAIKGRPVVSKEVGTLIRVGSRSDRGIMINSVNAFLAMRVESLRIVDFLDYHELDDRGYLDRINEFENDDSWNYVTEVQVVSEAAPKELSDNAAMAQSCIIAGDMGCEALPTQSVAKIAPRLWTASAPAVLCI